jgi:hypothetical protein
MRRCMSERAGGPSRRLVRRAATDQSPAAGGPGPHPVSEEELRAAFERSSGWSVVSVSPDRLQTRLHATAAPAITGVILG